MRILSLITDGFGGRGGIAKFNRDLLSALCATPRVREVIAIPRLTPETIGALPEKLRYHTEAVGSKGRYLRCAIRVARASRFDLVWCGHINLLPAAWLASLLARAPLVMNLHGIEAWVPHRSAAVRLLLRRVQAFIPVSEFTRRRFMAWTGLDSKPCFVLPNCIDLAAFGERPRDPALVSRYHLEGKTVIMTLARLSAAERYKGIDEVLEILSALARQVPNIAYLICGDGDDRRRLETKAAELGLPDRTIFTGHIAEEEKANHYRLADAFVMPGWGEGFGIVYLEALACGVPVVASRLDASQEAVGGELGVIVNPKHRTELREGILRALSSPKHVPSRLNRFSSENFRMRVANILEGLDTAVATKGHAGSSTVVPKRPWRSTT